MTNETPITPFEGDETPLVYQPGMTGSEDNGQIQDDLKWQSESHLNQGASLAGLQERADGLRGELVSIIQGEKELRIERFRLSAERERLHKCAIELRKSRLQKESLQASHRSRLASLLKEVADGGISEIERLEQRKLELEGDVDAFKETLTMHRRDSDRIFNLLVTAQNHLQDSLTEDTLWKIVMLESEVTEKGGRRGKSGVAAELLGRLLVLEKEGLQLVGLINQGK